MATVKDYPSYIAELTARNEHWAAAASIAARYGSNTEEATIDQFAARAARRGYSEPSEIACRSAILAQILSRVEPATATALRKAL